MEKNNTFALLGTSIGHGQPKKGVEKSYEHMERIKFWPELLEKYEYQNFGALPNQDKDQAYNSLFHKTLEIINSGYRPLLFGGDHSQAFATVSALLNKYPDLRIIWVDAHADLNTPETSPSGNSHGMPLSGLFGWVDKNIWGMPWMNQLLKPHQVIHLGVRDMDEGEVALMKKHEIEFYRPEEIRKKGLSQILADISQRWKDFPTHLSFDIDGLDQSLVPATGTPVGEGLNMNEGLEIIQSAKKDFNLVSCEIVEFNPLLAANPEELKTTEDNVKLLLEEVLKS